MLSGQVQRRMKASVKMVGDMWYTCWINAGQPDLNQISGSLDNDDNKKQEAVEQQSWLQRLFKVRSEGDD